ncbi:uncharacterized protein LOC133326130 [Musca vetustissima]|uniref:uncharacterized protein LOC133326130 n=1 Tax=Musca vetustissima TaxID=27455 RepID=UPI002AB759EB|nr:uncharacterized protein LOC133326130 [Musca vetustissima]
MAKFFTIIAIIGVSLALVAAEPTHFRQAKRLGALRAQKTVRKSARQEVAPSPAPYPPAGVTPEIPFELPTETEQPFAQPDPTYGPPEVVPDETYGPPEPTPDETYGPPEADQPAITEPDQTYGPPETEEEIVATPDETYGPPEASEPAITEPDQTYGPPETATTEGQPAIEEPAAEEVQPAADSELVSQNIIQPRQKLVRSRSRPAKLRARKLPAAPRASIVEIIHSEPVLVYTLH